MRCLGIFLFRADGAWNSGPAFKRGREFLQYFISYPRAAASREALVSSFWPELDAATAAHRLHLAVSGARAALRAAAPGIDGIRCYGGAYFWDPDVPIESDAETLVRAARQDSIEVMKDAASLYAGEYLAGEAAEWIYPLRVRCSNSYAHILERIAEDALVSGDYSDALEYALRLIEADRAHEGAARLAMRSLAVIGRRGAALAVFDALAAYLHHHLALEPSASTIDLRSKIIEGLDSSSF